MVRVLVCGDRNWIDYNSILAALVRLGYPTPHDNVLIEGEARGADTLARLAGNQLVYFIEAYPADWYRWGMAAGPIRNKEMLEIGKPDIILAFHDHILNSRGTSNMITLGLNKDHKSIYLASHNQQGGITWRYIRTSSDMYSE